MDERGVLSEAEFGMRLSDIQQGQKARMKEVLDAWSAHPTSPVTVTEYYFAQVELYDAVCRYADSIREVTEYIHRHVNLAG